ncbi:MAG: flagellar basal body rod protein FlgB [Verrucomicrobia bacterium]|nr:flagellar basal body rod protein FlgB [Verrucomicrobiota bacterium]
MIEGLYSSSSYQGLQKMLDATVMRHEAIASNLANLETPNYKRIDVDTRFDAELSRAIGNGNSKDIARLEPRMVVDRTAIAANRDGNTVQLEKEMLSLQQNSMAHRMQTQFITGRLMKLKSAIQGKVG